MNVSTIGGPASNKEIELGCEVRDLVTKFQGIAVGKLTFEAIQHIHSEVNWTVEHQPLKGHSRIPNETFPAARLERVGDGVCHRVRALKAGRT